MEKEIDVSGTLVWYYYICERQVWLIGRNITPDQDDTNVLLGRFIQGHSYPKERKELSVGKSKMDVFYSHNGELVVSEVKKTSRSKKSAYMQMAFYMSELQKRGVNVKGELRFPQEKRREKVVLDKELEKELEKVKKEILRILYLPKPPLPEKKSYCKNCAYSEFCWI